MVDDVAANRTVVLACGANVGGAWGRAEETLALLPDVLERHGIRVRALSPLYRTMPVGGPRQPDFLNGILIADVACGPIRLLLLLKQLEAAAGRRRGRQWGPRPLDIDIIAFRGLRTGWRGTRAAERRSRLILPHPEMHRRAFVLVPLSTVAPSWRHPVLRLSVPQMLARLGARRSLGVTETALSWAPRAAVSQRL